MQVCYSGALTDRRERRRFISLVRSHAPPALPPSPPRFSPASLLSGRRCTTCCARSRVSGTGRRDYCSHPVRPTPSSCARPRTLRVGSPYSACPRHNNRWRARPRPVPPPPNPGRSIARSGVRRSCAASARWGALEAQARGRAVRCDAVTTARSRRAYACRWHGTRRVWVAERLDRTTFIQPVRSAEGPRQHAVGSVTACVRRRRVAAGRAQRAARTPREPRYANASGIVRIARSSDH